MSAQLKICLRCGKPETETSFFSFKPYDYCIVCCDYRARKRYYVKSGDNVLKKKLAEVEQLAEIIREILTEREESTK